jgi:hypothetical protein
MKSFAYLKIFLGLFCFYVADEWAPGFGTLAILIANILGFLLCFSGWKQRKPHTRRAY